MRCKVPNATAHFCDNVCRHRRECEKPNEDDARLQQAEEDARIIEILLRDIKHAEAVLEDVRRGRDEISADAIDEFKQQTAMYLRNIKVHAEALL